MTSLMHESEEVERIFALLIINVEWKWLRASARETVWANVIASFPADYFADLSRNSFAEDCGKPVRNLTILHLLPEQAALELPPENYFHRDCPKTCSNVRPGSLPETKSSSWRARSALIAPSVLGSSSRLSINSFANCARSVGESERASSATARFVSGMELK